MKYLVRLKPLNPFFFGSNKTFSNKDLHSIKSTLFPQQTHVLGMIRKVILEEKGYLKLRKKGWWVSTSDFKHVFDLVGGFDNRNPNQKEEYLGKINSISPVFIISLDNKEIKDFHFISPKDIFFENDKEKDKNNEKTKYNLLKAESLDNEDIIYSSTYKLKKNFYFSNIDPKIGVETYLTTSSFWNKYKENSKNISKFDYKENSIFNFEDDIITTNSIFQEVSQVGIYREPKTRTVKENDDGSFYKKKSYQFINYKNCSFEFAFTLDFDNEMFKNGLKRQVFLGAERSVFQLEISKYDENSLDKFYPKSNTQNFKKSVVIGDIYDTENIKDDSYFILNNEYVPFARLERRNDSEKSSTVKKSEQKNLLPKGTVIYLDNNKKIQIENNFFTKIGFNQVIYI